MGRGKAPGRGAGRGSERRGRSAPSRPVPAAPPGRGNPDPPPATKNTILGDLTPSARATLLRRMEPVDIRFGDTIYLANERIEHVYFPTGAVISILAELPMEGPQEEKYNERESRVAVRGERRATGGGERAIEVGTIGRASFAGIPLVLGGEASPFLVMSQVPGGALRMPVEDFQRAFARQGAFREACLRAARAMLLQVGRNTACNAMHTLEERCAKWILQAAAHSGSDLVRLTHHVLSQMLGVRRAGVTVSLGELARRGLIRQARGRLMILDRRGLEGAACPCFRIMREDERRVMGE